VTALYLRLHRWRRPSLVNIEPDLFHHVYGLGFCTFYVCRVCLLEAYRRLRRTIERAVDDTEGR
jgi:hypothetical protein